MILERTDVEITDHYSILYIAIFEITFYTNPCTESVQFHNSRNTPSAPLYHGWSTQKREATGQLDRWNVSPLQGFGGLKVTDNHGIISRIEQILCHYIYYIICMCVLLCPSSTQTSREWKFQKREKPIGWIASGPWWLQWQLCLRFNSTSPKNPSWSFENKSLLETSFQNNSESFQNKTLVRNFLRNRLYKPQVI